MNTQISKKTKLENILSDILATYDHYGGINHVDGINMPSYSEVIELVQGILNLIFPGFFCRNRIHSGNLKHWSGHLLDDIYYRLVIQVSRSLRFGNKSRCESDCICESENLVLEILESIPRIRELLKEDVQAAYDGDPAAKSKEEIIISYPGIQAISMYRTAHEFYRLNIPLLPRLITEYAHTKTGIDIHPGAKIGKRFFIDHGTGVVIGETCEIGDNVKIYQMVTLGAISFKRDGTGELIRETKRHPTIEDDVILYAGCTILGGNTVIGKGSIIGGNVWINQSVDPETVIIFDVEKQEYRNFHKDQMDTPDQYLAFGI